MEHYMAVIHRLKEKNNNFYVLERVSGDVRGKVGHPDEKLRLVVSGGWVEQQFRRYNEGVWLPPSLIEEHLEIENLDQIIGHPEIFEIEEKPRFPYRLGGKDMLLKTEIGFRTSEEMLGKLIKVPEEINKKSYRRDLSGRIIPVNNRWWEQS